MLYQNTIIISHSKLSKSMAVVWIPFGTGFYKNHSKELFFGSSTEDSPRTSFHQFLTTLYGQKPFIMSVEHFQVFALEWVHMKTT